MQEDKYDAELHNTVYNGVCFYGDIYNDKKGRFPDGTSVRTSKVVEYQGDFVKTMNTTYKIIS